MSDAELLGRFVGSFQKLDDLLADGPVPPELDGGMDDSPWARQKWKPAAIATDPAALAALYRTLPKRLPPLYEQLIRSYRWLGVELDGLVRLRPNPPGPTLDGLAKAITADPVLVGVLFPLGLIPFGKAPGDNYDPICFDTRRRRADGDCPVVRVEHEAILCDLRLGDTWEIAPSFRALVEAVVSRAAEMPDP